jgi:hypothetical protein
MNGGVKHRLLTTSPTRSVKADASPRLLWKILFAKLNDIKSFKPSTKTQQM